MVGCFVLRVRGSRWVAKMIGGIDLGGTKIEARLFDGTAEASTLSVQRIATPAGDYDRLLDALIGQIDWLMALADRPDLPIGIAIPGIIDPVTGVVFAANIAATDQALGSDLAAHLGRSIPIVNDAMAFAMSEALGGAGAQATTVLGLVLGTGMGGGIYTKGGWPARHGGLSVEIGHTALSADALSRHGLPTLQCGCGRMGCAETYVSGSGLTHIAEQRLSETLTAQALVAGDYHDILGVWADILGTVLVDAQLMLAPDCIVLGGGLSGLPDVAGTLLTAMDRHKVGEMDLPDIRVALHGDSSGARGAALVAARC